MYVLRGIQTFTVDKAAMISSRQLLLLLYIYLSPQPRVPTFFTSRRYKTHSIYFSKCFMACLEKRPGIYFFITYYLTVENAHIFVRLLCVRLYEIIMFCKLKISHFSWPRFQSNIPYEIFHLFISLSLSALSPSPSLSPSRSRFTSYIYDRSNIFFQ